ncbi:UNVERIFIED_CONTAM: hypothetical protein GTU68_039620 [Idotea baltica]|nr:hypothetical protein [Idotea baltica]
MELRHIDCNCGILLAKRDLDHSYQII